MIFNILYSFRARQDLRDIYEYIAYELLEPGIAAGQVNRIMKNVVNVIRIMYAGRDVTKQLNEIL